MRATACLLMFLWISGCAGIAEEPAVPARTVLNAAPIYPPLARRMGIEGVVRLRIQVLADGSVAKIEVAESSGNALLDGAAIDAAKRSKFQAARDSKGRSVTSWLSAPYRFVLVTGPVMQSNRSFDADDQRRSFALLRSFPPVAGQLRR
jgi:TonB family protein